MITVICESVKETQDAYYIELKPLTDDIIKQPSFILKTDENVCEPGKRYKLTLTLDDTSTTDI